jgi:hypothetical protein
MSEKHPIQVNRRDVSLEERIKLLEICVAQLWDQVWWLSLPEEKRAEYRAQGFTDPIEKFYGD